MLKKYIVETNSSNMESVKTDYAYDYFMNKNKLFCIYLAEDEEHVRENSKHLSVESIKEVMLTLADKPYIPKD